MWWGFAEALFGLFLIVTCLVDLFTRVPPGPAWLWGRRDLVTGTLTSAARVGVTAWLALGAGFVGLGWSLTTPSHSDGPAYVIGLLCIVWSIVLSGRAARLRRTSLG